MAPFRYLTRASPSAPAITAFYDEVRRNLESLGLPQEQLRGRRIGITAGSRGVAGLKQLVRAACSWLRERKASPFVFPAMGSHGGATAEGQQHVLESYGVTEDYVRAPILSSMEVVRAAQTAQGFQVFMDRNAWEADGVIILNRVKPHTSFSGRIESGLLKMMAVGMGKQRGAQEVHRRVPRYGYEAVIREISGSILKTGKVICGLAVVENECHQVCGIHAVHPEELPAQEEAILEVARTFVPRIPVPNLQLLIVDQLGKNVSGTGMDTKVIGRGVSTAPGEAPAIDMIYVRDLTPETEGNAIGVGFADLVHDRIHRKIDFEKTYMNARTSLNTESVRLPMSFPSDRAALEFALDRLSCSPADQRIAWIRNTVDLDRVAISEPLADMAVWLNGWEVSSDSFEPQFDGIGDLIAPL